ncbi:hypothetical protein BGZ98_003160 [Dissophora globulifera]|nr:hypothetical protein BGZ98_003160 [Dissophora globulifera]
MADMEIDTIQIQDAPKQLTNRQMSSLVSLWRLGHYKQAPWSTWSILFSQRRPKRSKSPMLCFDTPTYEMLRKQRDEELERKQRHQHQIWQHVQERLAEQQRILDEEENLPAKQKGIAITPLTTSTTTTVQGLVSPVLSTTSSATLSSGSGSGSPDSTPTKRSIRWGLQNNMIKLDVPSVDTRPVKSALKVRTVNTIQKDQHQKNKLKIHRAGGASAKPATTMTAATIAKASAGTADNATAEAIPARKHAVDFF